jgi:hypothetical protein
VIALTAMLFAAGEAREKTAERDWMNDYYRRRMENQQRAQKIEAERRAATPAEPGVAPRP